MKTVLLIKIIVWSIVLIALLVGFIYACVKMESPGSLIGILIFFVLAGYFPARFFYFNVVQYNSKPNPTDQKEVCIDGQDYIQYEDHNFCCHERKNSTFFTSLLIPGTQPSPFDTCTICGKPFFEHCLRKRSDFFQSIVDESEWMENVYY